MTALANARLAGRALRALHRAGAFPRQSPRQTTLMFATARQLGPSAAMTCAISALRTPDRPALIDDDGTLTFAELDRRAAALAGALQREHGVGPGRPLALMARNGRGFVVPLLAASRLRADALLLNTEFPGPQLAQALERRRPAVVVHDAELAPAFEVAGYEGARLDGEAIEQLIRHGTPPRERATGRGQITILSSGTTGVPKGTTRSPSPAALLGPLVTLLEQLELRSGDPMLIGPPLYHGFGLAYLGLALFLGCPLVLRQRFEAEVALADAERQRVACLVAVPVMLQRMLALPERDRYDCSSLRAIASAGAPLAPQLATQLMDAFGDVLFNLYGTTETGFASIAGPADLRAAPGTVGRAPLSVTLQVLDDRRVAVAPGETGHVFMGGELVMDGYDGGGSKERVGALMNTGDLGHFDAAGRLFIDGREDDMIVSGGENVFPLEVEETLALHADVADVVVTGVEDAEFGQRLRAHVVRRPGAEVDETQLLAHVRERLARYKLPREVVFLEEIPRTATGKPLRRALSD
jgi:fatty-acyl-CoA synthase